MRSATRLIALTIIAALKAKLTLVVFCLLLGASAWAQGFQHGEKRSSEVFTVTDLGPNVSPVGINARAAERRSLKGLRSDPQKQTASSM